MREAPTLNDTFLRAARRAPVDHTPVWLMRQAGRYMAEYRQLRQKYSMLEIIRTPELAVQVTMQPIERFPLDAAIIFSDLLPVLIGMGVSLEYAAGEGPVIYNPVRSAAEVEALRVPAPEENVPFVLEAVRLARRALDGRVPLIGFAGAPFTLASYLIEGGGSRDLKRTKGFMHCEPAAWAALMGKLAELSGRFMAAQVAAGAQAVQMFDSWVGALGPADYREFVLPYSRVALRLAAAAGAPVIHFSTDTGGMLEAVAAAGGDVIGLDWRVDLAAAWARLGPAVAVQGNLDPAALLAPAPTIRARAAEILAGAAGRPGHIFNLGHGVLPDTPLEHVQALIDYVHEWRPIS